jgi:hypothetical protein
MIGELTDPNYWERFRNQSQPMFVTIDGPQEFKGIQSEGAWRITIGCIGTVGISLVNVKFNNGQEITLRQGDQFLVLDGQPWLERDDTFDITVTRATLVFIRDVVKKNVVKKIPL